MQRLISSVGTIRAPFTPVIISAPPVSVNGETVTFDAFSKNDSFYFKLRDLAYVLNGTNKQFDLGWDSAAGSVTLTSSRPYSPDGSEMRPTGGTVRAGIQNANLNILKDGVPVTLSAYLVEGHNFIKLRDLMELLDIEVTWNATSGSIGLNTSMPYND